MNSPQIFKTKKLNKFHTHTQREEKQTILLINFIKNYSTALQKKSNNNNTKYVTLVSL